jgi:hypothetical protein
MPVAEEIANFVSPFILSGYILTNVRAGTLVSIPKNYSISILWVIKLPRSISGEFVDAVLPKDGSLEPVSGKR